MSRKVALITGVTGQDGSYLAEFLLAKVYEVHGLIRRSSTFNTSRIDHIYQDPHDKNPKLFLHYGDLIDGVGLTNLIREIKPTEVYNLGAQSHVQVSFTMPQYTGQVDAVGAVGLLERAAPSSGAGAIPGAWRLALLSPLIFFACPGGSFFTFTVLCLCIACLWTCLSWSSYKQVTL